MGRGGVELLPQATAANSAIVAARIIKIPSLFAIAILRLISISKVPSSYMTDIVVNLFPPFLIVTMAS